MENAKSIFKKNIATFLSLILIILPLNLPTLALPNPKADDLSAQYEQEDSTFVLSTSNIQTDDETYYSEAADAIEQEAYDNENLNSDNISTYAASLTVGDPMVYLTQKWLNQEYGSVSGFGSVTENGKTGWNVIYGLTRALQHELGITSLANNFGPSTSELYSRNLLHRQDGVTNRMFAILQGALWCKGYSPGYKLRQDPITDIVSFDEVFDADVEKAVIALKKDAGLENPNGVVTVNVMKALLSMDAFKLLGQNYGGRPEVRAMQQKINRKYEDYTGLIPCDGVYGRNTNKALIYAFQAEEGMPVSVASGSFKSMTKSLTPQIPYVAGNGAAKTYQGNYYTSTKISAMTELMQFALFIHGFGDGNFNGSFNSVTKKAVRDFQEHYALPKTGIVNLDTWMALLVSSGNPDRRAIAADCAMILNAAKAKTLYDNGYRYIGRYLTGTYGGGISKALTVEEANIIINAGLRFFPIYQSSSNAESYFTPARGTADAQAAIEAAEKLGLPEGTIIYFAVDFDAMDYQITDSIIPYFEKVNAEMSKTYYRTGIYGARNVCSRVAKAGYSCSSFVGDMSTGFSGNLGFKIPDNWAFSQFANLEGTNALGSGDGRIEIDKDAFSGRDQGVGKLRPRKKAIYVLPGYMGSKLFTDDGKQYWIEGTGMNISLVNGDNIPLVADMAKNAVFRKSSVAMLKNDGSGSKLSVNSAKDKYGAVDTYKALVQRLESEFNNEYSIEFFPYNWLGDLNDSVKKLRNDIKLKGYSNVIFITHSTGGLLGSAFIADNNKQRDKIKVDKAILIAAPLFGTYASLAPLETGVGALIGEDYKLVDGFAQAAKFGQTNPHFAPNLKEMLKAVTEIYNGANNWVKDVAHNSPTTYQLLPSAEYIKVMPQLYENEFKKGKAVTSINEYYSILNGSKNINPNLTNGNSRSHKYFRDNTLGGDIVSVLQTVDTLLIASKNADKKTPIIAKYENKLFGGTRLKEIVYRGGKNDDEKNIISGDGTVQYYSATANDGSGEKLAVFTVKKVGHTDLVSNEDVLNRICNEINNVKTETNQNTSIKAKSKVLDDSTNISDMIKINYTCDKLLEVSVKDNSNEEIAKVSADDFYGFDGCDFIYYSYSDESNESDATIYIPNSGYNIAFKYGDTENEKINFNSEISTLNDEGLKDVSILKSIEKTSENGIILSIDGTTSVIKNDNISSIISGTVQNHFTDWELPNMIQLENGSRQNIEITGSDAELVTSSLQWTSADEQIVSVSQSGIITAVGFGKTTVSATDGNKSCKCDVIVTQNATAVNLSDVNMLIGERKVITPQFVPATATETAMTYTYDKSSIINIDENGVIIALAAGTVTVTGTTDYGISSTFTVNVEDSDFIVKSGDINDDGFIDLRDLVRLKKYLANTITLSQRSFKAADINSDNTVNTGDMVLLRRILLGIG